MPPEFVPNLGQLQSVWLAAVEFRKNERFELGTHGAIWSLDVTGGDVLVSPTTTTQDITVVVLWEPDDDSTPFEQPFELSVVVAGDFNWPDHLDEDYRRGWTEFNSLYLLWPYVRSHVSMITGAAGLPPLYLPTLAVPRVGDRPGDSVEFEASLPPGEQPDIAG